MLTLTLPLTVIAAHFVGDWFCQTDRMALNKSKSVRWLLTHTLVANLFLLVWGWKFALINFLIHTVIDAITSRITSRLWFLPMVGGRGNDGLYRVELIEGYRHWFFVTVGFDQLLHYTTLALTYAWLVG